MRFSHALEWNPKTGALRALILPASCCGEVDEEGPGEKSTGQEDDREGGLRLSRAGGVPGEGQKWGSILKPIKGGETHLQANLRLNVTVGGNVGWYRRANAKGDNKPRKDFPECLPDLYQDALVRNNPEHPISTQKYMHTYNHTYMHTYMHTYAYEYICSELDQLSATSRKFSTLQHTATHISHLNTTNISR